MISIKEVIIVEGKYDRMKLQQVVDGVIIATDGFRIFSNRYKSEMIKRLAAERGLLVLTDSDAAGFKIRNFIKGIVEDVSVVKHAYIPDILGKERRKEKATAEGKLGVEGMDVEILREAIERAGAGVEEGEKRRQISKADLFELGLLGGEGSAEKRRGLCRNLGLPQRISTTSLLEVLNILYTYEEICEILEG